MEIPSLNDITIIFGLSIIVILICHYIRVSTIVGFLLTGVLAGPYGLELVGAVHEIEILAEIGVVLLLFAIGIEFSIGDLIKEAYSMENAWGLSTAIDIHGCNPEKIQDEATIKRFIYELYDFIKMKRYGGCMVMRFGEGDMIGYSVVQLIETSPISAHFVDATSAGYIDIFSCKYYRPEDALAFCKDFFEAKDAKYNYLLRV